MEITPEFEAAHYDAQGHLARMGNYYKWILDNFDGAIGRRVWDAGAGIGNVTELLTRQADFVLATELTERNLATLRTRFAGREDVVVAFCDLAHDDALDLARHDLDTIITLDVLEHIEADLPALHRYRQILRPGGRLLIKVPAHMALYGTVDEQSLHYRRYSKGELREKLQIAGFEVERLKYMNMAATLPYFLKSRVFKQQSSFSNSLDADRIGLYDKLIPWLARAERILPVPFGLSVIAVARAPGF
ncbi:MAG: class I SAM-dependent methyltransferase [Planctomycetota bacterium]|nr:MAG: class I SAM-dependent methyltransferase [Planctomycetota bacterium]